MDGSVLDLVQQPCLHATNLLLRVKSGVEHLPVTQPLGGLEQDGIGSVNSGRENVEGLQVAKFTELPGVGRWKKRLPQCLWLFGRRLAVFLRVCGKALVEFIAPPSQCFPGANQFQLLKVDSLQRPARTVRVRNAVARWRLGRGYGQSGGFRSITDPPPPWPGPPLSTPGPTPLRRDWRRRQPGLSMSSGSITGRAAVRSLRKSSDAARVAVTAIFSTSCVSWPDRLMGRGARALRKTVINPGHTDARLRQLSRPVKWPFLSRSRLPRDGKWRTLSKRTQNECRLVWWQLGAGVAGESG